MTRQAIITELFTGKNFSDCIRKMEPAHLRDDLKQEVILVICALPDDKLMELHARRELEFYTVRVIINMVTNKYSPFYKKFRQTFAEIPENIKEPAESPMDMEQRQLMEDMKDTAICEIGSLYWYDAELVKLYMKHGNFRAVSRETGIPVVSCYDTIKKAMLTLKQKALCTF